VTGPPLPPGAIIFTNQRAKPAFVEATSHGFVSRNRLAAAIGKDRRDCRDILDFIPNLRTAWVTYPGNPKNFVNHRWHCRMIHKDEAERMSANPAYWVKRGRSRARAWVGLKTGLPPSYALSAIE
jgi:hypothetical protein